MRDFVPAKTSFRVILERSEESRIRLCFLPKAAAASNTSPVILRERKLAGVAASR